MMNKAILKLDRRLLKEKRKKEFKELQEDNFYKELMNNEKKALIWELNAPPKRSLLEEIGNAITHGVGVLCGIVMLILMLLKSESSLETIASTVYGGCLIIMMLMSTLYHAFKSDSMVKRIFRRFDYSSIYLLIGGTFAPLFLVYLGNQIGIILFIIQWALIIFGISFVCIFGPGRFKWIHFTLYFVLGWSGGIIFAPLWIQNDMSLFLWILGGGLAYTLGMIPFALKNVKAAHFIWHFFVLAGAIIQWVGIYLFVF